MHIGRAHQPPPDIHAAEQSRIEQDLAQASPVEVARTSAPTGESLAPALTYHPVTDLIARQHLVTDALPPTPDAAPVRPEAYEGTPPPPSVVDLRA